MYWSLHFNIRVYVIKTNVIQGTICIDLCPFSSGYMYYITQDFTPAQKATEVWIVGRATIPVKLTFVLMMCSSGYHLLTVPHSFSKSAL